MLTTQQSKNALEVDDDYDLPYAIAYGKLTWFLWVPSNENHREWTKINEDITVKQRFRGSKVIVNSKTIKNKKTLLEKLGLWYDEDILLKNQPHEIKTLYKSYPIRFPKTTEKDFIILFTAAVLSPQVSWEDNTNWTQLLYYAFKDNMMKIANIAPEELDYHLENTLTQSKCIKNFKLRRLGYHAKVLVKAFQDFRDKYDGKPEVFFKMPSHEARLSYLNIHGIGPKISMFLIQATHCDFSAPCVDRHVFRMAKDIGFIKNECIPYNASMCNRHMGDCKSCPSKQKCATYQIMRYNGGSLVSALLYLFDSLENL